MADETNDERTPYVVVINDDEQYSIWRRDRPLPAGWREVGFEAGRTECLAHIEQVWTDMRPLTVRRALSSAKAHVEIVEEGRRSGGKNDLVIRLEKEQPISLVAHPSESGEELKEQLERRRLYVRFDATGTELGFRLSDDAVATAMAAVHRQQEPIPLEGELVLNFERVRFVGSLHVRSLKGLGRLEIVGGD
jgi:uncharacterized protein YbdZ (MbtH family)